MKQGYLLHQDRHISWASLFSVLCQKLTCNFFQDQTKIYCVSIHFWCWRLIHLDVFVLQNSDPLRCPSIATAWVCFSTLHPHMLPFFWLSLPQILWSCCCFFLRPGTAGWRQLCGSAYRQKQSVYDRALEVTDISLNYFINNWNKK